VTSHRCRRRWPGALSHYSVGSKQTYMLVADGRAFTASRGYLELCAIMGGFWHLFGVSALIPSRWRDALYADEGYRCSAVRICALLRRNADSAAVGWVICHGLHDAR